jgi:hypothetical protein
MKAVPAATQTIPEMKTGSALVPLLLATVMLCAALPALAQRAIPWNALSDSEQSLLQKYRGRWSGMDPAEQDRLRQGAHRYLNLPPDKRQAVERKHRQYEQMPPGERQRLKEKYRKQKRKK